VRLRTADVLGAAAAVLCLYAALRVLWGASAVVLVAFLGVYLGVALSGGAARLARRGVPRGVGVLLIVAAVAAGLGLLAALVAPTLAAQAAEIERRLPEAVSRLSGWLLGEERRVLGAVEGPRPEGAPAGGQLAGELLGLGRRVLGLLQGTVSAGVYAFLVFAVAVYVAAEPEVYRRGALELLPRRARRRAGAALAAAAASMRRLLATQLIAMASIGVIWAAALLLLDVRAALALAVIAALLEFIPTVGPALAVLPALAMALLDSPARALAVLVVYLGVQGFESHMLTPLLMRGRMRLPPAVTLLAQALLAVAFGLPGLLAAVPATAAVLAAVRVLRAGEPAPSTPAGGRGA
jgi:predicted PurR-regulated permease PerM